MLPQAEKKMYVEEGKRLKSLYDRRCQHPLPWSVCISVCSLTWHKMLHHKARADETKWPKNVLCVCFCVDQKDRDCLAFLAPTFLELGHHMCSSQCYYHIYLLIAFIFFILDFEAIHEKTTQWPSVWQGGSQLRANKDKKMTGSNNNDNKVIRKSDKADRQISLCCANWSDDIPIEWPDRTDLLVWLWISLSSLALHYPI